MPSEEVTSSTAPAQDKQPKRSPRRTPWGVVRGFWHTFVSFANLLLLILLLGSLLSKYISPTTTTLFAYLGLFFPVLLVLTVLQALYWYLIRAWSRAVINTLMLLLSIPTLLLYMPLLSLIHI